MKTHRYCLFETPLGRCGIAWSERGVIAVRLPEARDVETRARLLDRAPDAQEGNPPPEVAHAIGAISALLSGAHADLSGIDLDMDGVSPFHRRVYEVARTVLRGQTTSYGELAARAGAPGAARAVGQALGRNPFPVIVPCHRVLAAGGKVGGFSGGVGIPTKLRMLNIETVAGARAGEGALVPGFDPADATMHLRATDPRLARLIDTVGPCRLEMQTAPSTFLALVEAIVHQQLNGRAAATIFARLCALFPHAHAGFTPEQVLRVSDERLRGAGLSNAKLLSLRDLARRTAAGEVPPLTELRDMDDEEVVEQLSRIRGIGRWTVQMLLIFRLGRPDVLPVDDYGVRKGFAVAFGRRELPDRDTLAKRGMRWRPYRTVASWYLWRAAALESKP